MRTELLSKLYDDFGINQLPDIQHGRTSDRLGKLYEKYVLDIFKDIESLKKYSTDAFPQERCISSKLLKALNLDLDNILDVSSSDANLGRTLAGGKPKTDATIKFIFKDRSSRVVPLNIKHSSKTTVSIAEYDVNTICKGIGIPDGELKNLMLKHQAEQSASAFYDEECLRLTQLLMPYREKFIRWCITLSAEKSEQNILHPDLIIRFKVKNCEYKDVTIQNIDDYVNEKMKNGEKKRKRSRTKVPTKEKINNGFGTGLSWTYASGSGEKKMQFKG